MPWNVGQHTLDLWAINHLGVGFQHTLWSKNAIHCIFWPPLTKTSKSFLPPISCIIQHAILAFTPQFNKLPTHLVRILDSYLVYTLLHHASNTVMHSIKVMTVLPTGKTDSVTPIPDQHTVHHRWNQVSRTLGQQFWLGWVGLRVSALSDLVHDPVLSFNMCIYRGVVSTGQHYLAKLISAKFHAIYSISTDSDNLLML